MPYVTCDKCGGKGTIDTITGRKSKTLVEGQEQDIVFKSPCDKCGGSGQVKQI